MTALKQKIEGLSRNELLELVLANIWYVDEGHIRCAQAKEFERRADLSFKKYEDADRRARAAHSESVEYIEAGNGIAYCERMTDFDTLSTSARRHFNEYLNFAEKSNAILQPKQEKRHAA